MKISNIDFSTFNSSNKSLSVLNRKGNNHIISVQNDGAEEIEGYPITTILNAVEIDWNGAILENADIENGTSKTINTTADLLELINEMQKEIYVIGAAVIAGA